MRSILALLILMSAALIPACLESQTSSKSCKSTITGTLEIKPIASTIYGNERNLRIWLPPEYNEPVNAHITYPVLYMFDGQWLFDRCTAPAAQGEWNIDETLTKLINDHQVAPIIVVGIDSNEHRDSELSPFGNPLHYGPPKTFQGAHIPEFLTDEVLPYIAAHYRIKSGREHTGVGGSSLGGVAALTALLVRPDIFGIGLLESTAMQVGNGEPLRETMPVVMGPLRISIGVGTEELGPDANMLGVPNFDDAFVNLNRQLAENFKAALASRPEVKFTVQPDARHGAAAWRSRFPSAVKFLYPPMASDH